ncbi:MAG: hypothetical protein LRY51_12205 [Geovibrio sp.]|nr:hypothetical protein [Geovibrio sp.]
MLVITSGANRVDTKLIRDHLGEKPDKADADFVREKTGYVIGGVPAIAHKEEPIVFSGRDTHGVLRNLVSGRLALLHL